MGLKHNNDETLRQYNYFVRLLDAFAAAESTQAALKKKYRSLSTAGQKRHLAPQRVSALAGGPRFGRDDVG